MSSFAKEGRNLRKSLGDNALHIRVGPVCFLATHTEFATVTRIHRQFRSLERVIRRAKNDTVQKRTRGSGQGRAPRRRPGLRRGGVR